MKNSKDSRPYTWEVVQDAMRAVSKDVRPPRCLRTNNFSSQKKSLSQRRFEEGVEAGRKEVLQELQEFLKAKKKERRNQLCGNR